MVPSENVEVDRDAAWPLRVLVAEDDIIIRMDVAASCRERGWQVIEVGTADDALAVLQRDRQFQLLLTDVHMPGVSSGVDLARRVREEFPEIKIAVMSGQHLPASNEFSLFDLFLVKPVSDIVKALNPLMSLSNVASSSL